MATELSNLVQSAPMRPSAREHPFFDSVWHASLVPFALVVTAGIVLDRYAGVPLMLSFGGAIAGLGAWAVSRRARPSGLPLLYLALASAALGAAYHHWHRDIYAADDIGEFVAPEPQPVQVRGVIEEEPTIVWHPLQNPLQSFSHADPTVSVLRAMQLKQIDDWVRVSGRASLIVSGHLLGLHAGDEVEVVGRLAAPHGPANPGETDFRARLRDQRIRAQVLVVKTPEGVTRLTEGWTWSFHGWLAVVRGWGQQRLQEALPAEQSGVATALLLGQGSTMTGEDWEIYKRSGVIYILIVAGIHLVVLAMFLWWLMGLAGISRSRGALFVALFLLGYAFLTGGRPPALRSAVTVCVFCGSLILRRTVMPANSLALAWLVVAALDPTDLFDAGCQLSFLAVAVLHWGPGDWFQEPTDPLEREIEGSLPLWHRHLRKIGRRVGRSYAATVVLWLAMAPLVAAKYHMVTPVGILIGPPLMLLASLALVAGFLLLVVAAVVPLAVPLFAAVAYWCLATCDFVVRVCDQLPGGHWYLGDVPEWWLWVFYPGLLAVLTQHPLHRRWRWAVPAGLAWLCVGLLGGATRAPSDELRCTFLAVGHGGCTVLEAPDGRTLLYDAGALSGPDVTRRQIAPFLWSRGIHRVDEVLISHADLDHFNGLLSLLDRFAVGQVTCTPTFADKDTPGVRLTVATLEKRRIPLRIVRAGDRLAAGRVQMDVLHPPGVGPEGNENTRSMVLLIRHAGHKLLLTGDLEGSGLDKVLASPALMVDVLQAPHHGSRFPNKPELAAWAQPKVVVSCEGPPRGRTRPLEPYTARGATFLGTWPHGAVTIRSHESGLVVETFQSGQRLVVRRGPG